MKTVTIPLVLPEELYLAWTRRSGDDDVALNEAIVKCMTVHHMPGVTSGARCPATGAGSVLEMPKDPGQSWSRRWDDVKSRDWLDSQPMPNQSFSVWDVAKKSG